MLITERELLVYNEDQFIKAFRSHTEKIYIPAYSTVTIMHTLYEKRFNILNNNIFKRIMGYYYFDYDIQFNDNNIILILKEGK